MICRSNTGREGSYLELDITATLTAKKAKLIINKSKKRIQNKTNVITTTCENI